MHICFCNIQLEKCTVYRWEAGEIVKIAYQAICCSVFLYARMIFLGVQAYITHIVAVDALQCYPLMNIVGVLPQFPV